MKKILFAILVVIVLSFSMSFAAFSDVAGTKYENAVTVLNNMGIVDGFGDGTFKPQDSVTRAQLCKMLVEGLGLKNQNNVVLTQFSDVNTTLWSYNYIKAAVDNGGDVTAVAESAACAVNIYAHHNVIVVENADAEILIYNAMGRLVVCRDAARHVSTEIRMNTAGVYIVKVGNVARRVMIND